MSGIEHADMFVEGFVAGLKGSDDVVRVTSRQQLTIRTMATVLAKRDPWIFEDFRRALPEWALPKDEA